MKHGALYSLKGALIRRLLAGLLVIAVICAVVSYLVSTRFANRAYDRSLFDDVQVLADQVRWVEGGTQVTLSPEALLWLLADEGDDVIFRVTDLGNHRVLASNGNLGELPDLRIRDREPYFRSVAVGNDRLRVAYVRRPVGPAGAEALVEIGETTRKRENIARGILVGTASIISVFILATMGLVWTGVTSALRPLRDLEAEVAGRSLRNMQPLDPRSGPAEVRGLLEAINHMIERVVHAIEVQRHFLANAAHQLKTPVAGLRLQAQLALKAGTLDDARANMQAVEQRAAHSAHLIDQLLLLARVDAIRSGPPDTACDLARVVSDVIERFLPESLLRGIDLGLEHPDAPVVIDASPLLIGELASNLVDNALRYGKRGGRVTCVLAFAGRDILFSVADDGPGLPESERERVFERFWRSDSSVGDGAGLGLAIVKEIADRYRATIAVESRPEFDGTLIAIRFKARTAVG